jgi:cytidylate kinase
MKKDIIITIGRQFGSGGRCLAEILGRKLGIPVYDNELITKAAQESGFSAEFFEQSDEKRHFFSFSSIFAGSYGTETENYMSDKGLFSIQCETIKNLAEQGPAIMVGRCSDYVLRERGNTLDIFLTSPMDERVKRVAERQNLTEDKAREVVEKQDKKREEYYNYYTFGNWGVASNYDLCIDSSILGLEGTADMIIDFAKKAGLI